MKGLEGWLLEKAHVVGRSFVVNNEFSLRDNLALSLQLPNRGEWIPQKQEFWTVIPKFCRSRQ